MLLSFFREFFLSGCLDNQFVLMKNIYTKNNLEKGIIIKCKIEENKYEYFYPPTKIFTEKLKLIE